MLKLWCSALVFGTLYAKVLYLCYSAIVPEKCYSSDKVLQSASGHDCRAKHCLLENKIGLNQLNQLNQLERALKLKGKEMVKNNSKEFEQYILITIYLKVTGDLVNDTPK